MPVTSLSAMYMPTQKGSSLEASPLPAGSNTGGEWSLVPLLSLRVDQISFRELIGCSLLADVGIGQGIMSPKKGKRDARCPLLYYTLPSIGTTDSSYVPIDFLS